MRTYLLFTCLILLNVFNFLWVRLDGDPVAIRLVGIICLLACIVISVSWIVVVRLERK